VITVAIRGPSHSGKTTVGRLIEKALCAAGLTCQNTDPDCYLEADGSIVLLDDPDHFDEKVSAVAADQPVTIEIVNQAHTPTVQRVVTLPEWKAPSCLAQFTRKIDNLPIAVDVRYVQAVEPHDNVRTAVYMGERTLIVVGNVESVIDTLKKAGWGT
jgi:hypothetical protein